MTRTTRGDTTIVMTQGSGKWGAPHDALQLLRVPGTSRETTFGSAHEIEAMPDGGVLVVDTRGEEGLVVRQFDANGKFVRNIGRQGPGPGEYLRPNLSIAVNPKGSIYLRDGDRSVSVFGRDGKLASNFALNYGNGSTNEIVVRSDGSVYIRAPQRAGIVILPTERPFFHYDLNGKLRDSVTVTKRWLPEGAGDERWLVIPDGRIVFTRNDKVGFMVIGATGTKPLIGEVATAPVPYLADERKELQVARNLVLDKCDIWRGRGGAPPPRVVLPVTKLPAGYGSVDTDGRIWITKSTTARKIPPKLHSSCMTTDRRSFKAEVSYEEPPVFAAFQLDGTYLGEVRFPLRAHVTFVGNTAWALVPDADDVQTLVKYRLY